MKNINRDYIEIIATALADKTGIKIMAGSSWSANPSKRTLQYDRQDIQKLDFDTAKGLLLHEAGHIKYTTGTGKPDFEKKWPMAGHDTINAFEDMRIEQQLENEYGDFAEIPLSNLAVSVVNSAIEKGGDYSRLDRLTQFLLLTLIARETRRSDNMRAKFGFDASYIYNDNIYYRPETGVRFSPEVSQKFRDNYDTISDTIGKAQRADTTAELAKIVGDNIIPIVNDFMQEGEKELQRTRPQGGGNARPKNVSDLTQKQGGQMAGGNSTIKLQLAEQPELARTLYEYGSTIKTLRKRIGDILEERKATKWAGGYRQGRLLSKNAYKILNGESRIFSHKLNNKPSRYTFYFAVDNSGSMNGKPSFYAVQTGQVLQEALKKLDLPLEFYSFDDNFTKLQDIDGYQVTGGNTDDTAVLNEIAKDMATRDGDKIVFTITDGQIYNTDARREAIEKVKRLDGHIFGVAVGHFIESYFRDNFENSVIVKDIEDMPKELIGTMRRIISR